MNLSLDGPMPLSRKQQVVDLLKSLETKNPVPFAYVNPNKYIQHNLQVGPGPAGVAALIQNMPPDASVNTIRVFEDGDYVFAHTEYNFFGPRIGFDIFRYEDSVIVEHWDNLQETATEPSPSGHTMIDGPTEVSDLDQTGANKALMQRYMNDLLAGRRETFPSYFNGTEYIQHNPWVADTIPGLITGLQALAAKGQAVIYKRVYMVLGEGNFVLVVAEAMFGGVSTAIYDLFRIANGRIAEHWDTLDTFHQKRLFRYPCTCAVPTVLRAGERGLTDAFIVLPNGMPAGFRYSIWSRSRSHCELQGSTRFTSIYPGQLSIDSVTRTSKSAFATCIAPREPRMT